MKKRLRLSKKRQGLVTEYLQLVKILARYFVAQRAQWQRAVYVEDLEGEGYLALVKAARTYDPARLPYPKAYFARACLNAMLKYIRKATRTPGQEKVSLSEAAELSPLYDAPDYLALAIADLPDGEREIAADRFQNCQTLRSIADTHQLSLRAASVRSRALARTLAESLDIRLQPRGTDRSCRGRDSNGFPDGTKPASGRRPKGA